MKRPADGEQPRAGLNGAEMDTTNLQQPERRRKLQAGELVTIRRPGRPPEQGRVIAVRPRMVVVVGLDRVIIGEAAELVGPTMLDRGIRC